jgi:hypothetical protein
VPKLKELHTRYKDQGLVLIGVHTPNKSEMMEQFALKQGINYPIVVDTEGKTKAAYAVDSFPDYYLIDRQGNLRVADLANGDLDRVVKILLAEKAPEGLASGVKKEPKVAPALAAASAIAVKKDKRLLVMWGNETDCKPVDAAMRKEHRKLLFNEYEVVRLERANHTELAAALGVLADGVCLSALESTGAPLNNLQSSTNDGASLGKFLEANRVPAKDAEVLWKNAMAQAQREKKNILVHLGAPW